VEDRVDPVQLLGPDGTLRADPRWPLEVTAELCSDFYRRMVLARRFDDEAVALQRQGELGLWLQSLGQGAAQVGSITALRPGEHVFPSYREHAAPGGRQRRPRRARRHPGRGRADPGRRRPGVDRGRHLSHGRPHSTSDDPGRYRTPSELDDWKTRDPIACLEALMVDRGWLEAGFRDELDGECAALAADTRRVCRELPLGDVSDLFRSAMAEETRC
jgi:TPP-dependent pyruvate/acetoin dehydrogenase alpha subunit